METKTMLPDSTQSETTVAGTSSAANHPPSARDGSTGRNSKGKKSNGSKTKKRKSEDRTAKNSKKKIVGKDRTHKEQKSSKKSKKDEQPAKKAEPKVQDSDLDLENDVKPIRDYIEDREEMLQHMFKSVLKADKLQAMLPDILKGLGGSAKKFLLTVAENSMLMGVKVEELQQLCLLQLEGMSKSRIMSILAGEEMQSSSEDEESDLDAAKEQSKMEDSEDNLINSEVVDSTSSLPQASVSVGDVEEVMSTPEGEEEVAGIEADSVADDNEEGEGEEDDVASLDNSWHDDTERHSRYLDEDEDMNENYDDAGRHEGESDADSITEMDQEEETVVQKPKKYRRFKIVRAEGEECEEGEITSDEVETDEESVHSSKEADEDTPKPEGDTMDATPLDTHPGADAGEGEASLEPGNSVGVPQGGVARSPPNSGNLGNDDNSDDISVDDDISAHVDTDVGVTKDLGNNGQNVNYGAIVNKTTSGGSKADAPISEPVSLTVGAIDDAIIDANVGVIVETTVDATVDANVGATIDTTVGATIDAAVDATIGVFVDAAVGATVGVSVDATVGATIGVSVDATVGAPGGQDIVDDSLNIFAEDNLEIDSEENVVRNSDQECLVEDGNKVQTNVKHVNSDQNSDNVYEEEINTDNNRESKNGENALNDAKNVERKPQATQAVAQARGATGTAKSTGRKVAQELEVLELELRARAIRSLMKQYGKDVG